MNFKLFDLSGVWAIGNIGRQKGNFKIGLLGAFLVLPLMFIDVSLLNWSSLTAAIAFEWKAKSWRREPYREYSCCRY